MIHYKKTPLTLSPESLEMFNTLQVIEEKAMSARNAIYKRYAELCHVTPVHVYIDDKTGVVSVIETSEK